MEIKDRMEQVRVQEGLSVQAFEKRLGVSNGTWKKSKSISEDVLIRFVRTFPNVSSEWLLLGDEGLCPCGEKSIKEPAATEEVAAPALGQRNDYEIEHKALEKAKAKIVVEFDLDEDEFLQLGLSSKVVQILKQK